MNNEQTFFPGLLPSPEDSRDFPLSAISPIPANITDNMPRTYDIPIHNQGSSPSCVGHACAVIRSYLAYKQGIKIEFDGEWIYQQCKLIDGMPGVKGTFFRAGLEVLRKVGARPIDGGDPAKWKIEAYAKVDNIDQLDEATVLFGAVLQGFRGSNQGWRQATIREPKEGEAQWGHAVARTGFGRDKFGIIQNSWGEKKGDRGIFYCPPEYQTFENWVVTLDKVLEAQPGLAGYVAKDYVVNGKTTARVNLRRTPSGTVIKVLPAGTAVKEYPEEQEIVNGILWIYCEVI
jgi:hypothetical protein